MSPLYGPIGFALIGLLMNSRDPDTGLVPPPLPGLLD